MKKIGLIALALVLALGALGAAYATWSQTLTITEEVNTGTFIVGVRDVGTNDGGPALGETYKGVVGILHPESPPTDGKEDPGYSKNVAAARSVDGEEKCMHEGTQYFHDVTETIVNAYPSYSCTITLEFANCGTVPAIVESVIPGPVTDPDGLFPYVEITSWEIRDDGGSVWKSGSGLTALEAALQGYQLDPCDVMQVDITKHIIQEIGDDPPVLCPQDATMTMTEDVKWVQWNVTP